MGWTDVPWYTICTERFSADFGVDEWFGLNVFLRDGQDVYRTYFLQHGAMVQFIGSLWSLWSLTPYGGQSDDEDLPEGSPRAPQSFWFRRHDEFDEPRRRPASSLGYPPDWPVSRWEGEAHEGMEGVDVRGCGCRSDRRDRRPRRCLSCRLADHMRAARDWTCT